VEIKTSRRRKGVPDRDLEQELLDALAAAVAPRSFKGFDALTIESMVSDENNERLGAILAALLPSDGRRRTRKTKTRRLRHMLEDMAKRGLFTTDWVGYWHLA
jgi:hypothetical protein